MACAGERRKTKKIGNSVSISRVLFLPNPYGQGSLLSFIYSVSHPTALAFYPPPSHRSDGTPSNDGIHELAAPRWYSPMIAHRLVVSYTRLLTLTTHKAWRLFSSTDTCRRRQLLFSEVRFPMLPGLASPAHKRQNRGTVSIKMQSYCKKLD